MATCKHVCSFYSFLYQNKVIWMKHCMFQNQRQTVNLPCQWTAAYFCVCNNVLSLDVLWLCPFRGIQTGINKIFKIWASSLRQFHPGKEKWGSKRSRWEIGLLNTLEELWRFILANASWSCVITSRRDMCVRLRGCFQFTYLDHPSVLI